MDEWNAKRTIPLKCKEKVKKQKFFSLVRMLATVMRPERVVWFRTDTFGRSSFLLLLLLWTCCRIDDSRNSSSLLSYLFVSICLWKYYMLLSIFHSFQIFSRRRLVFTPFFQYHFTLSLFTIWFRLWLSLSSK